MSTLQLIALLSTTSVSAAMVVLGRGAELLERRRSGRCAACGRRLDGSRPCRCSD